MEMILFDRFEYFISSQVDKTDPGRQFAAPFKVANSRQDQTCRIPFKNKIKKQQKLVYTALGEMRVLMTLIHCSSSSTMFVAMRYDGALTFCPNDIFMKQSNRGTAHFVRIQ